MQTSVHPDRPTLGTAAAHDAATSSDASQPQAR
jgi:hypothetical protein